MADEAIQGENKEIVHPADSSPISEEVTTEKSEEEVKLEARKAELEREISEREEQVSGLEGTVESLKETIVRKRQERRGVEGEEQQPAIDTEALLAEVDNRVNTRIQPIVEENEKLRKAVLKSNEEALKASNETLKAKKMALDSINARIASATAAKPSATPPQDAVTKEVELSDDEARIAKELGLKNPRYMKETEVL